MSHKAIHYLALAYLGGLAHTTAPFSHCTTYWVLLCLLNTPRSVVSSFTTPPLFSNILPCFIFFMSQSSHFIWFTSHLPHLECKFHQRRGCVCFVHDISNACPSLAQVELSKIYIKWMNSTFDVHGLCISNSLQILIIDLDLLAFKI